jgi:hypothetical protein
MATSAILGSKPATADDYWIARYILLQTKPAEDVNPSNGFSNPRPPDSEYESEGPSIVAGLSASLIIMVTITALRIWIRFSKHNLRPGIDDALIVFGVVSYLVTMRTKILRPNRSLPWSIWSCKSAWSSMAEAVNTCTT